MAPSRSTFLTALLVASPLALACNSAVTHGGDTGNATDAGVVACTPDGDPSDTAEGSDCCAGFANATGLCGAQSVPPDGGGGMGNPMPQQPLDGGATPDQVFCGPSPCTSGTQQCCITLDGGMGGQPLPACTAPGSACSGPVQLACDGPEDCPSAQPFCCGVPSSNGLTSTCAAACDAGVELCHNGGQCPAGLSCCGDPRGPFGGCGQC